MPGPNFELTVDVVDDANNVVGHSRRGDVLEKGYGFRTVHVFAFDADGRLFLQHLYSDHPRSPGRYGSSVAGYLASGETYFMAAQRKTMSELGVALELRWLGEFLMRDQLSNKFVGLFVARVDPAKIRYDREVIQDMVAVAADQLAGLIRTQPHRFTPTFLQAYEFYRGQVER